MSVAQVCFLGAICKLLWQRIPEQFVKLMEVFSFNYSQKDLKINTYSKYFLNVSHRMNHFKWQMQHSESRDSQCSFTKWELQTADDIRRMGYSDHGEITAILQGGGGISHFSSKYYTNTDESIL